MPVIRRLLCAALVAAAIGAGSWACAEDNISESQPTLNEAPVTLLPLEQLDTTWASIKQAHEAGDLREVNRLIEELDRQMLIADVQSLDTYAIYLLDWARHSWKLGHHTDAAFYTRKALELSPNSPAILARALPLVRATTSASGLTLIPKIIRGILNHPNVALRLVKLSIYPLLIACSFGLFIAFVLCFANKIETLLRAVGKPLPAAYRGLLAPFVLICVLIVPLCFGPLWVLFVWSIVLYAALPQQRWLGFAAGALLAAWGALIPIRESLRSWLDNPGVLAMLDTASGDYHQAAAQQLATLASQRPDDGAVYYTLAQVLRRRGEYDRAETAMNKARGIFGGRQAWTLAQLGMIAAQRGDHKKAEDMFAKAEAQGLRGAGFYFNYSRLKFDAMDTAAAQRYLAKAVSADPDLTQALERREQLLGDQGTLAMAEVPLPLHRLIQSALVPTMSVHEACDTISQTLMLGLIPPLMCAAGAGVMFLFFFARKRRSRTVPLSSYAHFWPVKMFDRLLFWIPGGAWVRGEQPLRCAALVATAAFLSMPLLRWPHESAFFVAYFPEFTPYLTSLLALYILGIWYVGAHKTE